MQSITIRYLLSPVGRREALRLGVDARAEQLLQLGPEAPEWAAAVDLADVDVEGRATVRVGFSVRDGRQCDVGIVRPAHSWEADDGPDAVVDGRKEWDAPQSAGELLRWEAKRWADVPRIVAERAASKAAREKAREGKEIAERQANAAEWLAEHSQWAHLPAVARLAATLAEGKDPGRLDVGHSARAAVERAWREQKQTEFLAGLTPEEAIAAQGAKGWAGDWDWGSAARKAVAKVRDVAEAKTWISEHGSERLQRCVAENIEVMAAYRGERLALDRPGWGWDADFSGVSKPPRNPPAEAFDLLDAARKSAPGAELVRWEVERSDEDDDPDGEEERLAWAGYAAEAEFLGRTIVFGLPEDLRI